MSEHTQTFLFAFLFWILADVAQLAHPEAKAVWDMTPHDWFTFTGSVLFVVGVIEWWRGK